MGIFGRRREFLDTMYAAREGRLREAITDGPAQAQDFSTGNVRVFHPSPEAKAPGRTRAIAPAPMGHSESPSQTSPATKPSGTKKSGPKSSVTWDASTFQKWVDGGGLPKRKKPDRPKVWGTDAFEKWVDTGKLPKDKKPGKRKRAA